MIPQVYFSKNITEENIEKLSEIIFSKIEKIKGNPKVAIKVHFGEELNTRFVPPKYIKPITNSIKKRTKNYFITDTNTLYSGMRSKTNTHMELANRHGFGKLESEIIIADSGLENEVKIKTNLPWFDEVGIAKKIAESDMILGISHFKGHDMFSFGGTIKNLGMGCSSRSAKLKMHAGIYPPINENCVLCGGCVKICPANAISINEEKLIIDRNLCLGCGLCIGYCTQKAIEVPWESVVREELFEKCAEHAFGAIFNKKGIYFNYAYNITSKCDCAKDSPIIGEDIGILVSTDPVACDKAAYDLNFKKNKEDIFLREKGFAGTHIFAYAEKIGLGKTNYRLIKID